MTADAAPVRTLSAHLVQKGAAMHAAAARRPATEDWDEQLEARCVADDLTGVRKLSIRDFHLVGDGGADIGGWDLGPTSPELLLGVISTCLTHTYLCLAAWRGIPLERAEVTVRARNNDARFFGVPSDRPAPPHDIEITVDLVAPSLTEEERLAFIAEGEATCPIVHALRTPTDVRLVVA
ncbi:putative OsmC-like protein [Microbacterium resistens]|uniref:OsmC-like protein n=1 Tax=Microbacterium resistens TaxID=156977 RepID=A0ABU1SGT6_9MICO|nr:OsmC family protein [Microbacterium resistens]MDR6868824.1 putative OsmC-like protein [Microbacterium resistens]